MSTSALTEKERDQEALQVLRENPDGAFFVDLDTGELYARRPLSTQVVKYTGDFREMDGPEIRDFLAAAFARGD